MPEKQQSLIYIEQQNKTEAEFMSKSFVDKATKNRAYINALGAELVIKYLALEGVDAAKTFNLHSISKILEKVDISDIRLPNVHIDVRVVFDESQIFIPKSHFEYGLVPDVYFILKLAKDFKYVEFLGFIKPESINKRNANSDYYFVEMSDLTSPDSAKEFIQNFEGNTSVGITQDEMLKGRELSVLMADHNISVAEMKELFRLLSASSELRDSVLEFDNFETLSNSVGTILFEQMTTAESVDVSSIEDFLDKPEDDSQNSEENEPQQDTTQDLETSNETTENITTEDTLDVDFDDIFSDEPISSEEPEMLEMTEQSTDLPSANENDDDKLGQIIGDVVKKSLGLAAGTAAAGAIAGAAAEAAEISAAGTISEEAMKLAGVAGDAVSDLIKQNIDNQEEHLSKLDFENLAVRSENIEDEFAGFELANDSINTTDEYAAPQDLSSLEQVPTSDFTETNEIQHDVVDLSEMAEVENKNFKENIEDLSDLHNMSTMDSTDPINIDIETNYDNNEHLSELDFQNLETIDNEQNPNTESKDNSEEENLLDFNSTDDIFGEEDLNMLDTDLNMDIVQDDFVDLNSEDPIIDNNSNVSEEPITEEESVVENEINEETESISNSEDMELSEDIDMLEDDLIIDDFNEEASLIEAPLEEEISTPANEEIHENTVSVENSIIEENNETNDLFIDETLEPEVSEDELFTNIDMEEDLVLDDVISEDTEMDNIEANNQQQENSMPENNTVIEDEVVSLDNMEPVDTYETTNIDINDSNIEKNNLTNFEEINEVNNSDEDFSASEDLSAQEWLEDSGDNIESADLDTISDSDNVENSEIETGDNIEIDNQPEDIITEPEVIQPYEFAVAENSIVISDLTFKVGEIPIDINNPNVQTFDGPEQLGDLYNENVPGGSLLQNPGTLGSAAASRNKKSPIGGILGGIVVLIILGVVGFYVAKMLKPAVEEVPEPITDGNTSVTPEVGPNDPNALNVKPENVVNMENNTPTVQPNVTPTEPAQKVQQTTPLANAAKTPATVQKKPKPIPSTSFLNVRKLSWEVPDYISYNQQFKQYFQSAGKSLKLSLTTDLLSASEYVYSDQVRVSILYDKDGTFKDAKILLSSGSAQVDKIVLQTVNQTLNVLKAPNSVANDESTTVILKIYF